MGKMVRVVMVGLALAMVGYMHVHGENLEIETYEETLDEFYTLVENESMDVQGWKVRVRDDRTDVLETRNDFLELIDVWSNKLNDWTVDVSSTEWKAQFTYDHSIPGVTQVIKLTAYPEVFNGNTHYLTYETYGTDVNTMRNETVLLQINEHLDQLDLFNPKVYTELQATHDRDTTSNRLESMATNWMNDLGATPVESLTEDTFVSLSGYNSNWASFIETAERKMNVQLAIREQQGMGGRTTVTIGTPIITSEY